jgi:serine O-acetyltransferase
MCTVYRLYECANTLYRWKIPFLPKAIFYFLRFGFGTVLPYTASIGPNTMFQSNGLGIVIHHRAVIGANCDIGQGVTIGGRSGYDEVPVLGNHVTVGVGAKILGPVKIGDHAVIGANAVVIRDVPANAVAAGVPARIVRRRFAESGRLREDWESCREEEPAFLR